MNDILDMEIVRGFIRMCDDGWQQGWHERNGGNATYRLREQDIVSCQKHIAEPREWNSLDVRAENLGGAWFLTTGSGKYFRNVERAPAENIGIVEIDEAGERWRIRWGLENGARPTSEFPSHFMNHAVRAEMSTGADRVIYHAHVPNIIALTYILPISAREFTRILWKSATECPVVFPEGVGIVPWMVPGGADIAMATSEQMKSFSAVIWTHHGMFCAGPDFDTTFGLMHTIEKAAEIYVKILGSGQEIRQTISDDDLLSIAEEFGVQLNPQFIEK